MFIQKIWLGLALAFAAPHEPHSLLEQYDRVRHSAHPVIVFDLDDTLINTRHRTYRIIQDFLAERTVQEAYPRETELLKGLKLQEVFYLLADTLKNRGVVSASFLDAATQFWKPRFFGNDYSARDEETAGAALYVRSLYEEGATIVYLTGRDIPNMEKGTKESLSHLGFPLGISEPQVILLMKPDFAMDDLVFKKEAIEKIREMGEVVGVFENEPANLNMLHSAFPEAEAVFLDTIHSPKPDQPDPSAHWVANFRQR